MVSLFSASNLLVILAQWDVALSTTIMALPNCFVFVLDNQQM